MKIKNVIASIAAIACIVGCTASQLATATTIVDVAGNACEVVFVAVDPSLAPLCTTAQQLAQAVENAAASVSGDGGVLGATTPATNAQVYAYLKAHGATTVKQ